MKNVNFKEFYLEHSNKINIVLWIIFICWKIPFLNKGIDYTDTGFSLVNYRNVFYGEGIKGIGMILTTGIGGIIYKLLPGYQLLVYRAIYWIIGLITTYFAYRLFRRYLDGNLILIVLLGYEFISKIGEAMFSYYPLTSCFLMLSLLLIHNGLIENRNNKIFFAGVVSGVNVLFRLTNLLYFAMVLCIIFYGWIKKYDKKDIFKAVSFYALGCLSSFVVVIPLICLTMGPDVIIDSFMKYVNMALGRTGNTVENVIGVQEVSGHSLRVELRTIRNQGARSLIGLVCFIVPVIIIGEIIKVVIRKVAKSDNASIRKFEIVATGLIFVIAAFLLKNQLSTRIFMIIGISTLAFSLIMLIKSHGKTPEYELIFLTALLVGICSIFGSDLGLVRLNTIGNFIVLTVCILIKCIVMNINSSKATVEIIKKGIVSLSVFVFISVYVVGIFCKLPTSYNDADYSELKYEVNSDISVLKGMKTSETRVAQLNEYYEVMNRAELKDYEAVIFGMFPLGFAISDQENYFEDIQPCIDYPSVSVESLLKVINEKDEESIKPLIVISYVNKNQHNADYFTTEAKEAVLEYMLEKDKYETYYESENFLVYKPVEEE